MSGFPIPVPIFTGWDNSGNPLNGGSLTSYAAGTSTPISTFPTAACSGTPNSNPTTLDSAGRHDIYILSGTAYKFVLKDSAGNTIWTEDNVSVPTVPAAPAPGSAPTGAILMFGGSSAPTGYLLCDGSTVARVGTYAALWAVIGITYGSGDGVNTFGLPDFRQRFPLGKAVSGTGAVLGVTGGSIDHTHTGPPHIHTVVSHVHAIPHTHVLPRDSWGAIFNSPPVTGRIGTGDAAGTGGQAVVEQATTDNVSGAVSVPNSSPAGPLTDSQGSGNTGVANPPFQTVNFIIAI